MMRAIKYLFRTLLAGWLLFGGWLLLRLLVCDQFVVPSHSMNPTLIAGDRILVNKRIAGPRIYRSFDFSEEAPLESFRLAGRRPVRVGDVAVFNAPHGYDRGRIEFRINYVYAKRCIGAPGDSVSIRDGYFRNNRHDGTIGDLRQQQLFSAMPDSLFPPDVLRAFPFDDSLFGWTIRDFGPLYIPQAGATVAMDVRTWRLYRTVIEYETGRMPVCNSGAVRLGDDTLRTYTFRNDYYFFCGDNVANSRDSRYLGFVPEEFIIGVVDRVRYSEDPATGRRRRERRWLRIATDDKR